MHSATKDSEVLVCPEGWRRVAPEFAFADMSTVWETDRRDTPGDLSEAHSNTCCGVFAERPDGEFDCGISECSTTRTDADSVWKQRPAGPSQACAGKEWELEDRTRRSLCNSKKNQKS